MFLFCLDKYLGMEWPNKKIKQMRELEKERATPLMQYVWGKGGNKDGTVWDGVE